MITQPQPLLLPLGPTARRFRVPSRWLREEAEAGRVPCLKAGRALLFNTEVVASVLLERAAAEKGVGDE
ncbi:MAG: hypothetical protein V1790_16155 [Planctomycetota bacterium]